MNCSNAVFTKPTICRCCKSITFIHRFIRLGETFCVWKWQVFSGTHVVWFLATLTGARSYIFTSPGICFFLIRDNVRVGVMIVGVISVGVMTVGVLSVGVMTVGVLSVGVMTVGVLSVGVMTLSRCDDMLHSILRQSLLRHSILRQSLLRHLLLRQSLLRLLILRQWPIVFAILAAF
jgi:hypothetical protein